MPRSDLPFGSEFSQAQIDLPVLLELAHKHGADWRAFEEAVRDRYFAGHNTTEGSLSARESWVHRARARHEESGSWCCVTAGPLAAAGHESGGARTPRGGVFVDLRRSYGLGFGARGRIRRFRGAAASRASRIALYRAWGFWRGIGVGAVVVRRSYPAKRQRFGPIRAGGNPSRGR